MSFSSDIKKELCSVSDKDLCCRRSELAAILLFGGGVEDEQIVIRTERGDVFKRICGLLRRVLGYAELQEEPVVRLPMNRLDELGLFQDMGEMAIDEEVFDKDCCKRAFFRGAFLMSGTADPRKNYRLELFAYNETVTALASEMLENFGLDPKSARRKNYNIIYLEDYESVSDALIIMGAQKSMLALSYVQIEKDISNQSNRRSNFLIANMDRAMTVSANQCAAIDELARTGMLETLDEGLKTVAYARAGNPEMNLSELAELTGISKSTLSRRLNKLLELGSGKD